MCEWNLISFTNKWTADGFLEGEEDSFVKFRDYGWVLGAVNRAKKVGDLRETET